MGYYTTYHLSAVDVKQHGSRRRFGEKFFNSLDLGDYNDCEWVKQSDGRYALQDTEPCKWYEHDDDMLKASLEHNDVVFILDGEGEESGDVWRAFYLNGKKWTWSVEVDPPEFSDAVLERLR